MSSPFQPRDPELVRRGARNAIAIYLDALLLGAMLLLFSPRLTGLPVHEWIGLAVALPVLAHLLLSWSWISAGLARLLTGESSRARVNYALNAVLFVLVVVEVTSGIVISAVAMPTLGARVVNDRAWRALHNGTLNWLMLLLGFHVAMNWRPIVVGVRRYLLPGAAAHE